MTRWSNAPEQDSPRPLQTTATAEDPRKVDDAAAARAKELKGKGINAYEIGKMLGVSRATVYRYLISATQKESPATR